MATKHTDKNFAFAEIISEYHITNGDESIFKFKLLLNEAADFTLHERVDFIESLGHVKFWLIIDYARADPLFIKKKKPQADCSARGLK